MLISRHPFLYYFRNRKSEKAFLFANSKTDIVIEGFPRSANTFAGMAFDRIQSKKIRIAHHIHVPAQIIKGVQLKIPVVLLIRHPRDAVSSLAVFDKKVNLKNILKRYINFYKPVMIYKENVVVAPFEEVVGNFENIIRSINNKFGTNFDNYSEQTPPNTQKIFRDMEPFSKESETGRINEYTIARPSNTRANAKAEIIEELKSPQHRKLMQRAENIYDYFTS